MNGDLEYESHWITDTYAPQFNIRYSTPVLRNTTRLKIELVDSDNGHDDQIMERWVFNPITKIAGLKRLDGAEWSERRGSYNKIFIDATWIWVPDYAFFSSVQIKS